MKNENKFGEITLRNDLEGEGGIVLVLIPLLLVVMIFICWCVWAVTHSVLAHDTTTKDTCLSYEATGVLEKGSCACVEKIYKNWDESYDWKDACMIANKKL